VDTEGSTVIHREDNRLFLFVEIDNERQNAGNEGEPGRASVTALHCVDVQREKPEFAGE
jgi:hypothetical protein